MVREISLDDELAYGLIPKEEGSVVLFFKWEPEDPRWTEEFYWDFFINSYGFRLADKYCSNHQGISGWAIPFAGISEAMEWCHEKGMWRELAGLLRFVDPRWLDIRQTPVRDIGADRRGNVEGRYERLLADR